MLTSAPNSPILSIHRLRRGLLGYISDISIRITEIVDEHNMVDWQTNKDIHNKIAQDIDDMFYEIEKEKGIQVDFDSIDKIIENVITVALRRFK